MFQLSNGISFKHIKIWYGDVLLGFIENDNGRYKFTKVNHNQVHPAEFYFQPLTDSSSHEEIVSFMLEQLTLPANRHNRRAKFSPWVSTLLDEVYDLSGKLVDVPRRRITFE